MIACTSPAFTARSRPLRISLPSISTCRFLISNSVIVFNPILRTFFRSFPRKRESSSGSPLARGRAGCGSSDRSLERNRDQLLSLDRELHRQLLQHVLDEAVHDERSRLLRRQAALAAIEQHLLGNLRGRRLVLEHRLDR